MTKKGPSLLSLLFLIGLSVAAASVIVPQAFTIQNVIPKAFLGKKSAFEMSLLCTSLCTGLIFLNIIFTMLTRVFTSTVNFTQDSVLGRTSHTYVSVQINNLRNTIEQLCLFLPNLLLASSNGLINAETVAVVTLTMIAARFIFWGGYFASTCPSMQFARAPGVALTLLINANLFYINARFYFPKYLS